MAKSAVCRWAVLSFLLAVSVSSWAQTQPWDGEPFKGEPKAILKAAAAFPPEKGMDALVLRLEHRISIDAQGRVKSTRFMVYRVDTPTGVEEWAGTTTYYQPWHEKQPVVRARVISPDAAEHWLDPKSLQDVALRDSAPNVYSDSHSYQGPLPAVSVGAVVEEEITTEETAPFFEAGVTRRVWIGRSVPVLRSRVTIEAPESISLRTATALMPKVDTRKESVSGGVRISFDHGRLEAQESESNLPGELPRSAYVAYSTAESWQSLAKAYRSRTEPQIRPAEVKALLNGVTGTDEQKIAALLRNLHTTVRYTGVEFGDAALTPYAPAETLKRKYGDCKDKAAVLISALRAIGIPAEMALLNTAGDQDVDPNLPGMGLFDHAIVYLPKHDVFIDATAEYSRFREIPTMDQGRYALVIADGTAQLQRIPDLPSSANRTTEERQFLLAEKGRSRVIETTSATGSGEASLREMFASGDTKQVREQLEQYATDEYYAQKLGKLERGDPSDMTKPFTLKLEVERARRGGTDMHEAVVAIFPAGLANRLPGDLVNAYREDEKDTDDEELRKPRQNDWEMGFAFVTEYRYRIVPPAGFVPRELPENKTLQLGPAILTQSFKAEPSGVVLADLRFDSVKRRYTREEAKTLSKALKKLREQGAMLLGFDFAPYKQLREGKAREAMAAYRGLLAREPKSAIQRSRFALALLESGLGERAREEARAATVLDPASAPAWDTLGLVLTHDLFGRRFHAFDRDGAVAAYRKAIALDPADTDLPLALGLTLEHNRDAERYAEGAELDQAISIYRELKKNKEAGNEVNGYLLFALAYAKRFQELRDFTGELNGDATVDMMRLVADVGLNGVEKAMRASSEVTTNERERSNTLAGAAGVLMRMRMYPEAAALFTAAASGQQNASGMQALAEILRNAKKIESVKIDENDPISLYLRGSQLSLTSEGVSKFPAIMSSAFTALPPAYLRSQLEKAGHSLRQARVSELPSKVIMDIGLAAMRLSKEGDDATGYRITVQSAATKTSRTYVVKENGKYVILGDSDDIEPLGMEVLRRIDIGDLAGARKLLDWARDERKIAGGEDPLAGPVFPRLWSKGQEGSAAAMRVAGITLFANVHDAAKPYLALLEEARDRAAEGDKLKHDLALATAYLFSSEWPKLETVARRLAAAEPTSESVFRYLVLALQRQKKWEEAERTAAAWAAKRPDEVAGEHELATTAMMRGDAARAMSILKKLIDDGKATPQEMNSYGWAAVMAGSPSQEVIEATRRAAELTKNSSFAILHTLGCLYAEAGHVAQAREILMKSLALDREPEETTAVWYGIGRLAEHFGETEAAIKAYRRIEKREGEFDDERSTFVMAQRKIKALEGTLGPVPKPAVKASAATGGKKGAK